LSNEHPSSSYGKPVLVNEDTGEAYGPGDLMKLNPSGGYVPGYLAVRKIAEGRPFTEDEIAFIDKF